MEKLRRVLSGQDDEEQGLTAQVSSPAAGTAGGRRVATRMGVATERPGLSVPAASAEASGARPLVANPGIPGVIFPPFVSEVW